MINARCIRDDRLHDDSPTDVHGGVVVRVRPEAARLAEEVVPVLPVGRYAVPTLGACARSVARVYGLHGDTGKPGLVFHEEPKLGECPPRMSRPLRSSDGTHGPCRDAFQIFETYPSTGLFRLAHQRFADAVVRVALAMPLALRQLLEVALRGLRASGLELRADAFVTLARFLDLVGRVRFAIRVGSEVDDTEVYSEPVFRSARRRLLDLDACEQKPLAATVNQVGLSTTKGKQTASTLIADERHPLSVFLRNGPDGDLGGFGLPREYAVVVSDGSQGCVRSLRLFVEAVGISHLRKQPRDHLSGQGEAFLDFVVDEPLQRPLAEDAAFPGYFGDIIASLVDTAKRRLKSLALRLRGEQLDHDGKPHLFTMLKVYPTTKGFPMTNFSAAPFLPRLKRVGGMEQIR